jgi:hypothetical protein
MIAVGQANVISINGHATSGPQRPYLWMTNDPDELRRRAYRFQQMAGHINDDRAVHALQDAAWDYLDRADRIEATSRITAERLVQHLEASGFVIMKAPARDAPMTAGMPASVE